MPRYQFQAHLDGSLVASIMAISSFVYLFNNILGMQLLSHRSQASLDTTYWLNSTTC